MDWLETANGIVTLISALIALISTGIGVYFAIKNFVKLMKSNTKEQNWKLIMKIADAAMKTAETSGKKGADKKQMVIESVKASCKAAGIDNAVQVLLQLRKQFFSILSKGRIIQVSVGVP